MLKCIEFKSKKALICVVFVASRRLSLFGRVPYMLKCVHIIRNIDLDWFCNLEAFQPVWEGSLRVRIQRFL